MKKTGIDFDFLNWLFSASQPKITIENGALIKYIPGDNQESATTPEGVTSIGERASSGCTGLTSITLPEGLQDQLSKDRGLLFENSILNHITNNTILSYSANDQY